MECKLFPVSGKNKDGEGDHGFCHGFFPGRGRIPFLVLNRRGRCRNFSRRRVWKKIHPRPGSASGCCQIPQVFGGEELLRIVENGLFPVTRGRGRSCGWGWARGHYWIVHDRAVSRRRRRRRRGKGGGEGKNPLCRSFVTRDWRRLPPDFISDKPLFCNSPHVGTHAYRQKVFQIPSRLPHEHQSIPGSPSCPGASPTFTTNPSQRESLRNQVRLWKIRDVSVTFLRPRLRHPPLILV